MISKKIYIPSIKSSVVTTPGLFSNIHDKPYTIDYLANTSNGIRVFNSLFGKYQFYGNKWEINRFDCVASLHKTYTSIIKVNFNNEISFICGSGLLFGTNTGNFLTASRLINKSIQCFTMTDNGSIKNSDNDLKIVSVDLLDKKDKTYKLHSFEEDVYPLVKIREYSFIIVK